MTSGRFVVSTGRDGAEGVAGLLDRHPDARAFSDFFANLTSAALPAFPSDSLTGPELWRVLSTPRPEQNELIRQTCRAAEVYEGRDLTPGTIPPLMLGTLPRLARDPRPLEAALRAHVEAMPRAAAGVLYSDVLTWLSGRAGRSLWVECSASSAGFVDDLIRHWPSGRFVLMARDGRDVAVSMSRNRGFRMAILLEDAGLDRLAEAVAAIDATDIPIERFGARWSREIVHAHAALRALPVAQFLLLRHERLARDPARELRRLADFLGLERPDAWVADVAPSVEPVRCEWRDLPPADREALEAACAPGLRALGYD
jgi:hypothetical protein